MTNRELVHYFYDCFNRNELDEAESIIHPDILLHDTMMGEVGGIDAFKGLGRMFLTAFPDQHTTIDQIVDEGDLTAVLHTHAGTHLGNFGDVPPTGRPFTIRGFELFRIVDGKITEFWRHDDEVGLLRQLGLIPEPAAAEG